MSMLQEFARPCVLMEKKRTPDGEGGWITEWTEGAEFSNYMAVETSVEARIAAKQGVTSIYTALVDRNFPIEYNDAFKDVSSGKTFRVTSNPEEKYTPKSASISLKYFTAEQWELPT